MLQCSITSVTGQNLVDGVFHLSEEVGISELPVGNFY